METGAENLRYYLDELSYLREQGREFARRYPAVGARLDLSGGKPADPHVERLIESFALLTGRLQRRIDDEFPEIASSLLGTLYPQLATIVPPMTIACFEADLARGKWTAGHGIEAGTALLARGPEDIPCRFRTCYGVTLWPLRIIEAAAEHPARYGWLSNDPAVASVIRIRIECSDPGFEALEGFGTLRLHLGGDEEQAGRLYDLLAGPVHGIAVNGVGDGDGRAPRRLRAGALTPVGFGPEEEVLPYPPPAHDGYRLLQEYFHFPRKFLFFDLDLTGAQLAGRALDVHILSKRPLPQGLRLGKASFQLGCTPAVNLFPKTSEPVRIDHRRMEYRLVADYRRETTTEIHSILAVSASANGAETKRRIEPFYSLRNGGGRGENEARVFWHSRRGVRDQDGVPGTDVFLSFLDRDFTPMRPPSETVFAHMLCTNRTLAGEMAAGTAFELERAAPASAIRCLDKPTAPSYPPLQGAALWRLVSSLSLNHLSLGGEGGLGALKEILRLYCREESAASLRQVEAIRGMQCRPVVRARGSEAWRGFRHGLAIEIEVEGEERGYSGASTAMLSGVLRHFLALHASVNSFVEVGVRRAGEREDWIRWEPLAGYQAVL